MPSRNRIACLIAVASTFAFGAGAAQAAPTETVTNLNDSGAGSLRQALADVDAGGTVSFSSSVSGTIDLQTALVVDKSFTIEGPGASQLTIDAANRDNILVVGSVTPGNYVVVVEGLTFFRGAARLLTATTPTTLSAGGGIAFASGNSLTVRDSVFRQNMANAQPLSPPDPRGGGAIFVKGCSGSNDGADLTVESSTFVRNNSYSEGGAITMRSKGTVTIEDSEFRNNAGEGNAGGGALLVDPEFTNSVPACVGYGSADLPSTSPVTISDSLFAVNGSLGDAAGTAISFERGTGPKTIESSEITGHGGDGDGGAIYDRPPSPMTIVDSLFESNGVENDGGAIHNEGTYEGPAFTNAFLYDIRDSAFIGNSAEDEGGAIRYNPRWQNASDSVNLELRITDSEFIGNSSQDDAAAIEMEPSSAGNPTGTPILSISGSRFERNFAQADSEGSVINYDASVTYPKVGQVEIVDSTVDSNAGGEGGTPVVLDGAMTETVMRNVSITRNAVGDRRITGIKLGNDATFSPSGCSDPSVVRSTYELSNVTVAGNVSSENNSGALTVIDCGILNLRSSTVALNSITGDGATSAAGLEVTGQSEATVANSVIAINSFGSNTAISPAQGDCTLAGDSALTFEDANFVGDLTNCGAATGAPPITGNPRFAELDPIEVQRLGTGDGTFIVPLAANSPARGAALGTVPGTDQRGAARPSTGADLGAVQYYESHKLTVEKAGKGTGSVTSDWGEIACGEVCEDSYPSQQVVTLTADPDAGSAFTGWSGGCSGTAYTCAVTMDQAKTVTANFAPPGSGATKAKIRVRKAKKGTIAVGANRTFAFARVTCLEGDCSIKKAKRATVRIRGKVFKAATSFKRGSFVAGETRTIKVTIPKRAYRLLKPRKSGVASVFSFSIANNSDDGRRVNVLRGMKAGLKKKG